MLLYLFGSYKEHLELVHASRFLYRFAIHFSIFTENINKFEMIHTLSIHPTNNSIDNIKNYSLIYLTDYSIINSYLSVLYVVELKLIQLLFFYFVICY